MQDEWYTSGQAGCTHSEHILLLFLRSDAFLHIVITQYTSALMPADALAAESVRPYTLFVFPRVVSARQEAAITTTSQLVSLIGGSRRNKSSGKQIHPATRVFQVTPGSKSGM